MFLIGLFQLTLSKNKKNKKKIVAKFPVIQDY